MEEKKLKKNIEDGKIRSLHEINQKIKSGDVQVLPVSEFKKLVDSSGIEVAYKDVDVVTTGTFGAMCSSGARALSVR